LLISQQVLSASSKTMHSPVFWGELMQNVLRSQSLEELFSSEPPKEATGDLFRTEPLGHPSAATGDPYDVQVLPGGQTVVSLSGVGEIAIRGSDTKPFERFEAQAHSTALLLHPDGRRLLVANTFADSITIFDLKTWRIGSHVPLGKTPERTTEEWGEALFYDARLSLDGWYSCHSCHTDGHTTGHRTDNQSDLSFGAPKRILPLGGVGQTGPWAWNGEAKDLAGQIHSSIQNTMQGDKRTPEELAALENYVRTLKPAPSLDRMRGTLDAAAVSRGQKVFQVAGCADCHQSPSYTSPEVYDVGLKDEIGNREFNPPSLLGVSQRQELLHDGRAKSLSELFEKFRHGDAHLLNDKKRADLTAFLRSL
jgi:mono/diheme cytochrome c family protein